MAEMALWAVAGGFALASYSMAKRLGLLDAVPRDPQARVAHYSSAALSVVKDQLIGSELEDWELERVSYVKAGQRSCLWVEEGALHCRHGDRTETFPVGDKGHLAFSLEGEDMSVKIYAAESSGAERTSHASVRVRLRKSA